MANNERLTKRLKKIEDWVAENEEMGGPKGYMDTFVSMYQGNINAASQLQRSRMEFDRLRTLTMSFIEENQLVDEWNEFLKEQDNAVQEQQAEEVPLQEETESGEETSETPKKEIKD